MNSGSRKGFTLVELSIVLVIIGLLIGGILAGRSMIHTAKMDKFLHTLSQYEISVTNFRNVYKYYPGDDPIFSPPGDGNNRLESLGCQGTLLRYESLMFWTHLNQAQMLSKEYTPYSPIVCGGTQPEINVFQNDITMSGVLGPYTEISGEAEAILGCCTIKPLIIPTMATGNLSFVLYVNALDAAVLEAKLGSNTNDGSDQQVGLTNISGAGWCRGAGGTGYSCGDSRAKVGLLKYYFAP